jgi:hypothetical protein
VTVKRRLRRRRRRKESRSPPWPHPGRTFSAAARISSPPRYLRHAVTDHVGGGDAMPGWFEALTQMEREEEEHSSSNFIFRRTA